MTEGVNDIAEVTQLGVIAKYEAGCSRLIIKTDELPAEILVLPVTLISYNRFENVGHCILFALVCANMLLPLKSNKEIMKTVAALQSISFLGFLKTKLIWKFVKAN
jgi:hypothetical protein